MSPNQIRYFHTKYIGYLRTRQENMDDAYIYTTLKQPYQKKTPPTTPLMPADFSRNHSHGIVKAFSDPGGEVSKSQEYATPSVLKAPCDSQYYMHAVSTARHLPFLPSYRQPWSWTSRADGILVWMGERLN